LFVGVNVFLVVQASACKSRYYRLKPIQLLLNYKQIEEGQAAALDKVVENYGNIYKLSAAS